MNKKWNVIAVDGRCENDSPQQVLISTKKNQFHNENVYKFLSVSSALNVKMGEKNMRKMLLPCPVWETNEKKNTEQKEIMVIIIIQLETTQRVG